MSYATALIILAVVGYVFVRRFTGEPLEARRLILPPLILVGLGGYQLARADVVHVAHHPLVDIAVLGFGALLGVLGGIGRGLTVRVFVRDGHVWYRYTWPTLAVWIAMALLRVGQLAAAGGLGADRDVLSSGLILIVGLSFLGEAGIVARRAIATGAPFAPRGARRAARSFSR